MLGFFEEIVKSFDSLFPTRRRSDSFNDPLLQLGQ